MSLAIRVRRARRASGIGSRRGLNCHAPTVRRKMNPDAASDQMAMSEIRRKAKGDRAEAVRTKPSRVFRKVTPRGMRRG
jgi:hypothetical protein